MFLGSQIESNKSLLKGISTIVNKGGNVVQLFLRKMHSASAKDRLQITTEEKKEIKNFIKKNKVKGFVHASYLLNFCRIPVGLLRIQWAYNMLKEDMELGEKLGMEGVVIHMCSQKAVDEKWKTIKLTPEETIERSIQHIEYYFKNYSNTKKIKLLLENSASEGYKIGGTMLEFGKVFKPLYAKYGKKIGTCIDTCHAFASGYPINTLEGIKDFLDEYKQNVGDYSTLNLIHLNDSKEPLGSKKDRHEKIGKGYIYKDTKGKEALIFLILFAIKNKIPMCLETGSEYKKEISFIKKIYSLNKKGGKCKSISKNEIIKILEDFQEYHKSLGNPIQATQYSRAVNSIKSSKIKKICNGKELFDLPWVGKGIISKIDEYIKTGKIKLLEDFKSNPIILAHRNLTTVFGIGPKKAEELISHGILNVDDLKKNKNVKLTSAQKLGLKYYDDLLKKIPRKESENIRKLIENEFKKVFNEVENEVILAGSYHLGKKTSGDVDIVLSIDNIKNLNGILKTFVTHLFENGILLDTLSGSKIPSDKQTNYIGLIQINSNPVRHIDIHVIKSEELPFHMLYFGSGEQFSRIIRKKAKDLGYKLNNKGLFNLNGKKININTEKNVFKKLNLNWVPPKNRNTIV
jgi:DNA polymerase lambda